MSEFRIAKLEALLARVLERSTQARPAVVAPAVAAPAPAPAVAAQAPVATPPVQQPFITHGAVTTPPPPPVAVPEVSIPRQPVLASIAEAPASGSDEIQENTHVSRMSGPALVQSGTPSATPSAAQSHARIATAPRADDADLSFDESDEPAPVSSERTVDPSVEADTDSAAITAPPESTRQLATSPPSAKHASVRPSVLPDSAPRSVGEPLVTRGSLPPDANDAIEFRGELPKSPASTVGALLDATLGL